MCRIVMTSSRWHMLRSGINSVSTMPKPENTAPATKYGGKMVVCQPGQLRHGEVQRHDRVHGQHQRRRKTGENQIRLFVVAPVTVRAGPTQREQAVNELSDLRLGAIPHRRQVGNQADIPEQHRHGEIGRDGEHVPHQRRTELRPHALISRNREQPPVKPHAPDVHRRINSGAHHRENRHRFGGAVHARAPLLAQQKENRGDQRSGVADTDPPHEVDDVPAPHGRVMISPNADAGGDLVKQHAAEQAQQTERSE